MFNKEKLQRYSIRKLTVGAASVLVGISFMSLGTQKVNAATTGDDTTPEPDGGVTDNQATSQSQGDVQGKSVNVVEDKSGDAATTQSAATSKTDESGTSSTTTQTAQPAATTTESATNTKATPDQQTKDVNATSYEVQTIQTSNFENANPSTDVNSSLLTAKTSGSVNGDTLEINPQSLTQNGDASDSTKNIADSKADAKAASDSTQAYNAKAIKSDTKLYDTYATDSPTSKTDFNQVATDKNPGHLYYDYWTGAQGNYTVAKDDFKTGNKVALDTFTFSNNFHGTGKQPEFENIMPSAGTNVASDLFGNVGTATFVKTSDNTGALVYTVNADAAKGKQLDSDINVKVDIPMFFDNGYNEPLKTYTGLRDKDFIETIQTGSGNTYTYTIRNITPTKNIDDTTYSDPKAVEVSAGMRRVQAPVTQYIIKDGKLEAHNTGKQVIQVTNPDIESFEGLYGGDPIVDDVDKDGNLMKYDTTTDYWGSSLNLPKPETVADGMSIQDLYDATGENQIKISKQADGNYLIAYDLGSDSFKFKDDKTIDNLADNYSYMANITDPEDKDQVVKQYTEHTKQVGARGINLYFSFSGTKDDPNIWNADWTVQNVTPGAMGDVVTGSRTKQVMTSDGAVIGTNTIRMVDDDNKEQVVGTPQKIEGRVGTSTDVTYTVPDGYILVPNQNIPKTYTFKVNNDPIVIHLKHKANQKASLQFIDDSDNNKVLATKNWTGSAGDKETYDPTNDTKTYTDKGYVFVSSTYPKGGFTFDNDDSKDQNFVIHLTHGTKDVKDSQHPVNITETIHYVYGDSDPKKPKQAAKDYTATKPFVKTDTIDLVTNKVTNTVWTPEKDSFAAVTSPTVKGYTPDQPSIPVQNITKDSNPLVFTVTYNPDMQLAHVNYIDDNTKKSIGNDDLTGRSGQTSKYTTANRISEFENQGYELVPNGDGVPKTGIVFDSDDATDQNYEVHLKHGVDTKVDKNAKTVTETIHYVYPDGKKAHDDTVVKKNFDHTVKTDKVTKKVISDTWTPDQTFTEVKVPPVEGYTPDKTKIPAQTVNHGSKDIEETVTYTANPQTAKITYIDDDAKGKVLDVDNAGGKFGEAIKFTVPDVATEISQWEKLGYKLKSNNYDLKKTPTYQADNNKNVFEVHFVHGTSNKDENGKPIEQHKIVNETIHYVYSDGSKASDDSKSSKVFIQTGTRDLVTNKTTYDGDWTPANDSFAAVESPTISGYTPDKASVPAQKVNKDSKDIEETVTYSSDYVPTPDIPTTPTTPTTTPSNTTTPSGTTPSGTTPTTPATPTDNQTTTPAPTPIDNEPTPTPVQPETPTDNGSGDNGYTGGSDVDVPTGNNGGYSNGGYTSNNGNGSNLVDNNQGGSGSARTTYTSASGSDDVTARPLSTKEVAADDNNDNATSGESAASNKKSNSEAANESELPQTGADDNLAAKAFGLAMIAATGMVGGLWFRKRKD